MTAVADLTARERALELLKEAGNPFRNYFARNPDDDLCARYHVAELFARERRPLTENWPADPTPAPTPGPAALPSVWGGGATPGRSKASSSNDRNSVVDPMGNSDTSCSANEPPRRPSERLIEARASESSGAGGGAGVGVAATAAGSGSKATGTGTTSPVYVILRS